MADISPLELAHVEDPAPTPTVEDIERPTVTLADVGGMEQVGLLGWLTLAVRGARSRRGRRHPG